MAHMFFATTVRGVEDVSAGEVSSIISRSVEPDVGKVFFQAGLEDIPRVNYLSRTVHKVALMLLRERFETLGDVYEAAKRVDYTAVIGPDQSFAVRAERVGVHPFTSVDVASTVGQAVVDSYMDSRGVRLRVNLEEPDVELLCLVRHDELLLGVNTTGESLHRRGYRVWSHPAAISTTLASSMLLLSGWNPGDGLLDPMCGGATIPIEAALMASGYPPGEFRLRGRGFAFTRLRFVEPAWLEELRSEALSKVSRDSEPIMGVEVNPKFLRGSLENVRSAGVEWTVSLLAGDSRRLGRLLRDVPADVVTNPPYGVRMRRGRMDRFYRSIIGAMRDAGVERVTLITAAGRRLTEAVEELGVEVVDRREVVHGGMKAFVFRLRL